MLMTSLHSSSLKLMNNKFWCWSSQPQRKCWWGL